MLVVVEFGYVLSNAGGIDEPFMTMNIFVVGFVGFVPERRHVLMDRLRVAVAHGCQNTVVEIFDDAVCTGSNFVGCSLLHEKGRDMLDSQTVGRVDLLTTCLFSLPTGCVIGIRSTGEIDGFVVVGVECVFAFERTVHEKVGKTGAREGCLCLRKQIAIRGGVGKCHGTCVRKCTSGGGSVGAHNP